MAQNKTIKIDAGADYFLTVRLRDEAGELIELTGCSARMKLKKEYDSAAAMVSLTSDAGGGITFERFDDDSAFVDACCVHITNVQTGPLVDYSIKDGDGEVQPGEGVYDLEIVDTAGVVLRAINGMWIAMQEVTK